MERSHYSDECIFTKLCEIAKHNVDDHSFHQVNVCLSNAIREGVIIILNSKINLISSSDEEYIAKIFNFQLTISRLYERSGNSKEARHVLSDSLVRCRQHCDPNHPVALNALSNLASLCFRMSEYSESESLHIECHRRLASALGASHPSTLHSLFNLGNLYLATNNYPRAVELFTQCLQFMSQVFGVNNKDTLACINNLASSFFKLHRYEDAKPLFEQCLERREELLGDNHSDVLASINNLANVYEALHQYIRANELYMQYSNKCNKIYGANHPLSVSAMNKLNVIQTRLR